MSVRADVTVANWLAPDTLRWSFQHMADVFPTATIGRGAGPVAPLLEAPAELADVLVTLDDGSPRTVAAVVDRLDPDAWLVLHRGRLVAEAYRGAMTPATPHLLMSVSKSIVSTVAGALVARGTLDPDRPVASYVAELADSGYAGATVRQVWDMRSGIGFSEDYLDPASDVCRLDVAVGWAPRTRDDQPTSLRAFVPTLRRVRPHGGPFEYRSVETDVLGWVCEAAAGTPFPALAGELVWSRLGVEHDASITVDAEGRGMFDGGVSCTARDLGRFGAMVAGGGVALTGEQVVPDWWVEDLFSGGADSAAAFAAGPDDHGLPGGRYRSMFWFAEAGGDVALCLGIHGQLVYIDRRDQVVGVMLCSWPVPLDLERGRATLRMFQAIGRHLADS